MSEPKSWTLAVYRALPKICIGCWDARRLEQILTTLITDAFKFGEGRANEVLVEERAENGEGRGRLVLKLGRGLRIARQLLEAMGGLISVESTEGEGSAFVVELPKSA